jgi:hypothetical protein
LRWQREIDGRCQIRAEFRSREQQSSWGFQPVYTLVADPAAEVLVTDNDTNRERFGWGPNPSPYVKDGFHSYLIGGDSTAVNPEGVGTKAAPHYILQLQPGEEQVLRLRLRGHGEAEEAFAAGDPLGAWLDELMTKRRLEADEFYAAVTPLENLSGDQQAIQRQAFAGMLWSKQFYHLVVQNWLDGDPAGPPPPEQRKRGRNKDWFHLYNEDIVSMPDKWEYPWYAAWDLAFHTIALALIDPDFAKKQLRLFTREWFMHPNGQLPAYEWNFEDVNPPVHAWATYRVYQIERRKYGHGDIDFLEEVFNKLTLYFTWWVNRKDVDGNSLFNGGFLGLDNIGIFDRSNFRVCNGFGECAEIIQSDGTSWMAMFCLNMLKIATELAKPGQASQAGATPQRRDAYDFMASKFLQHFLLIADAMNRIGGETDIFDEAEGFYFDILRLPAGVVAGDDSRARSIRMKVRSMVGLIPMFALEAVDADTLNRYLTDDFRKRFDWFIANRPDLTRHGNICIQQEGLQGDFNKGLLLALVAPSRLRQILVRMLDEAEFFGPYGIRSLSKAHEVPFRLPVRLHDMDDVSIAYAPAESTSGLFGGNSNWRGPVWFPVNYLIIESLQKYHRYLGDDFKVECPTGSGQMKNLWEVAEEISRRLISIFELQPGPDQAPRRPVFGGTETFQKDPEWQRQILFYEYFHGDNGAGLGASHQTGWTGLIAKLLEQYSRRATLPGNSA